MLDDKKIWDNYWNRKRLCSIGSSTGDSFNVGLTDYWKGVFQQIPSGSSVVDMGTGNGFLPYLLGQCAIEAGKALQVLAVDSADIDPVSLFPEYSQEWQHSTFFSQVDCTNLPFETRSVDYIVSQYALEYMPINLVTREVKRCLKKGGQIFMVLHSSEGITFKLAEKELNLVNQFLDTKCIELAFSALESLHNKAQLEQIFSTYNQKMRSFLTPFGTPKNTPEIFRNAFSIISHSFANIQQLDSSLINEKISELFSEIKMHKMRLEALCNNVIDKSKLENILDMLRTHDFVDIQVTNNWRNEHNLGYQLTAKKASS